MHHRVDLAHVQVYSSLRDGIPYLDLSDVFLPVQNLLCVLVHVLQEEKTK